MSARYQVAPPTAPVPAPPSPAQHSHGLDALPAVRGPLMNPSIGEVDTGMSAGRVERGPRRRSWSSTIRPVLSSQSLRREMPAACTRSANGGQDERPLKAVSTSACSRRSRPDGPPRFGSSPSAARARGAGCHSQRYSSGRRQAAANRVREAVVVVAHDPRRAPFLGRPECRVEQGLAKQVPHQRVEFFGPCAGLWTGSVRAAPKGSRFPGHLNTGNASRFSEPCQELYFRPFIGVWVDRVDMRVRVDGLG